MSDSTSTVRAFVAAINAHDVDALLALMSNDHIFTDAFGETWQGRDTMRRAWSGYLGWFPDYKITVEETFVKGNTVVMTGRATGTFRVLGGLPEENHWELPAAWKAIVVAGLVSYWQVYADNEPVRRIMSENERV